MQFGIRHFQKVNLFEDVGTTLHTFLKSFFFLQKSFVQVEVDDAVWSPVFICHMVELDYVGCKLIQNFQILAKFIKGVQILSHFWVHILYRVIQLSIDFNGWQLSNTDCRDGSHWF